MNLSICPRVGSLSLLLLLPSCVCVPELPQTELQALLEEGHTAVLWVKELKTALNEAKESDDHAVHAWAESFIRSDLPGLQHTYISRIAAPVNSTIDVLIGSVETNQGLDKTKTAILEKTKEVNEATADFAKEIQKFLSSRPRGPRTARVVLGGLVVEAIVGVAKGAAVLWRAQQEAEQQLRDRIKKDLRSLKLLTYSQIQP